MDQFGNRTSILPPVNRAGRYLVLLVLLGLAVHLVLPQLTALEHSATVVRSLLPWAVVSAVVAQVMSYVGGGFLSTSIIVVTGQRVSLLRTTLITMAASSVGLIAGGTLGFAAATYRWLRGSGVSGEGAVLTAWLPSLLNNGALVAIAMVGLLHLLLVHKLSMLQVFGFGVTFFALGAIAGLLLWGVNYRSSLTTVAVRLGTRWARMRRRPVDPPAIRAAADRLFSGWDALRTGGWRGPAMGALLSVGCDMLSLYLLFVAARYAVSPGILLAGCGLPLLLGKVSFLPGGVGVVEGTMAALYDGLGVPDAVTVVVILAYRAISFWLPTLLGFLMVPYLQRVSTPAGGGA